ncbi:esterase lipase [Colletotrichum kahawae]|uniref:Esterase lipase n=1 Tax=Colletotrichum kahawae TaxID=34407 RepID=A0AAD9XXU6_COLKA|nr:esterase lipase [Colletotrichum kahawae]
MAHSYLAYIRLKAVISALRYFAGEKPAPAEPDDVFTLPGRDGKREIKVHSADVRGVVAFYPPTEMRTHPAEKRMLDGTVEEVPAVRRAVMGVFREAYLSGGEKEAGDGRVSVGEAAEGAFPGDVVVITAERDRLAAEAERFAERIGGGGRRVVVKRCEGVGHGFDKMEGEEEGRARGEAYGVVVEFLRGLVGEGVEDVGLVSTS